MLIKQPCKTKCNYSNSSMKVLPRHYDQKCQEPPPSGSVRNVNHHSLGRKKSPFTHQVTASSRSTSMDKKARLQQPNQHNWHPKIKVSSSPRNHNNLYSDFPPKQALALHSSEAKLFINQMFGSEPSFEQVSYDRGSVHS